MKKSSKEIKEAILKEALILQRKKEIYETVKKLNTEVKQLNEYGHPGVMLGLGFNPDHLQKARLGGYMNGSETLRPVDGRGFDELDNLEKEMSSIDSGLEDEVSLDELKKENESLKQRLAELENINESFFRDLGQKYKSAKTAWQAGKETFKQSEEYNNIKNQLDDLLAQANKKGVPIQWATDITPIFRQAGLKYNKGVVTPLAEGDLSEDDTEDLNEIFGRIGAMFGGAVNKVASDVKDTVKSATQGISNYATNIKQSAQASAQNYDAQQANIAAQKAQRQQDLERQAEVNNQNIAAATKALNAYFA